MSVAHARLSVRREWALLASVLGTECLRAPDESQMKDKRHGADAAVHHPVVTKA